jgi:hypothetical protein
MLPFEAESMPVELFVIDDRRAKQGAKLLHIVLQGKKNARYSCLSVF